MDNLKSQRFGVEEIRRIREEDDLRYQSMSPEEISRDIGERAKEARELMEKTMRERASRRGA